MNENTTINITDETVHNLVGIKTVKEMNDWMNKNHSDNFINLFKDFSEQLLLRNICTEKMTQFGILNPKDYVPIYKKQIDELKQLTTMDEIFDFVEKYDFEKEFIYHFVDIINLQTCELDK